MQAKLINRQNSTVTFLKLCHLIHKIKLPLLRRVFIHRKAKPLAKGMLEYTSYEYVNANQTLHASLLESIRPQERSDRSRIAHQHQLIGSGGSLRRRRNRNSTRVADRAPRDSEGSRWISELKWVLESSEKSNEALIELFTLHSNSLRRPFNKATGTEKIRTSHCPMLLGRILRSYYWLVTTNVNGWKICKWVSDITMKFI